MKKLLLTISILAVLAIAIFVIAQKNVADDISVTSQEEKVETPQNNIAQNISKSTGATTETGTPEIPVSTPPQPETAQDNIQKSTTLIDTSNWQTYRNDEYGFEVKYPNYKDIKIKQEKNLVQIYPIGKRSFYIEIIPTSQSITSLEEFNNVHGGYGYYFEKNNQSIVLHNNNTTIITNKTTGNTQDEIIGFASIVISPKHPYIYRINFVDYSIIFQKDMNIYLTMIRTFKIL